MTTTYGLYGAMPDPMFDVPKNSHREISITTTYFNATLEVSVIGSSREDGQIVNPISLSLDGLVSSLVAKIYATLGEKNRIIASNVTRRTKVDETSQPGAMFTYYVPGIAGTGIQITMRVQPKVYICDAHMIGIGMRLLTLDSVALGHMIAILDELARAALHVGPLSFLQSMVDMIMAGRMRSDARTWGGRRPYGF